MNIDSREPAAAAPISTHIGLLLLAAPLGATLASHQYLTVRAVQLAAPDTFSVEDAALVSVTLSAHLLMIAFGFGVFVVLANRLQKAWRWILAQSYPVFVTVLYLGAYLPHKWDLAFIGSLFGSYLAMAIAATLFLQAHRAEYPGLTFPILDDAAHLLRGKLFGYQAGLVLAALTLLLVGGLFLPQCIARTQARIERDSPATLVTIEPAIVSPSTCAGLPLHLTYSGSDVLVFNCRLPNRELASVVYHNISDVKISRTLRTQTPGLRLRALAWLRMHRLRGR